MIVGIFLFRDKLSFAHIRRHSNILLILAALTVLLTGSIWYDAKHNTNSVQSASIAVFSNEDADTNALTARLHYFSDAVMIFTHSPLVGFGPGNYVYGLRMYKTDPNYSSFADPHDWLLKMLVEDGIFVGLIFLIFIILFFWQAWKLICARKQASWLERLLFIGLLASAIHGMMDFDWSYNLVLLVFFCFAGALYGVLLKEETDISKSKDFPLWVNYILFALLLIGLVVSIQIFRADSFRTKGDYDIAMNDSNDAINSYFQSALINKYEPLTWFDLWSAYFSIKDYHAARYAVEKAIGLFPENGVYYSALAKTDLAEKNLTDYESHLLTAIKYFPAGDLTNQVRLADFYYVKKDYDRALSVIDSVIPIYGHYQSVLWFKDDPNSATIEANLKSLNKIKSEIGAATKISK